MGAKPSSYARSAPRHSYIHVDQFSGPKELADYLHLLDKDDSLYNQYFEWKGTGEFINTKFWCRVCALLHNPVKRPQSVSFYEDINEWWRADGVCANSGGWRSQDEETTEEEVTFES